MEGINDSLGFLNEVDREYLFQIRGEVTLAVGKNFLCSAINTSDLKNLDELESKIREYSKKMTDDQTLTATIIFHRVFFEVRAELSIWLNQKENVREALNDNSGHKHFTYRSTNNGSKIQVVQRHLRALFPKFDKEGN